MKILRVGLALFIFFGVAGSASAAETNPLTWDQCISLALKNNPELIASQKSLQATRADFRGSYNGLLPSLNFNTTISDSDSAAARSSRYSADMRASIDLFNMSNNADIRAAGATLSQAESQYTLNSAAIRFKLRQAFANLLFSQNEVDVSKSIRALRKQNSEMVTLKYNSGRESKGNMLRSNAELIEADSDLKEANRNLGVAKRLLLQQLGLIEHEVQNATGTLTTAELPAEPNYASLVVSNPSVESQQALLRLAQAQLKGAKSSLWPNLTANYTRSAFGDSYFPENKHWTASGVLNYPLFAGGLTPTYYAVKSAKRNYERSEAELLSTENTVRTQLESTWVDLATKLDQVVVQRAFLNAARQRNVEAQVRYSSGLMTFENWEPIVSDLVNFERSFLRAERDAVVAEASWNQILGKKLEEQ